MSTGIMTIPECHHECTTDAEREAWSARAIEQQAIGRDLRLDGSPRDECENIDQEYGWDMADQGLETER